MKSLFLIPLMIALASPPVSASDSLPPASPKPELGAQAHPPAYGKEPWTGSAEQKLWGLMTIWSEAKINIPYFDRLPVLDWDAKVREYIPRALGADSLDVYYEVLMEFAALLKDGHTRVLPPWMFVKPGHDQPPVELQAIEGRFFGIDREDSLALIGNMMT